MHIFWTLVRVYDTYHALVGDLEGTSAGHLIVDVQRFIIIGYQVTVDVVVQVALGNLVPQHQGIRESLSDRSRDYTCKFNINHFRHTHATPWRHTTLAVELFWLTSIEEVEVFSLIMSGVPVVLLAVLARFDNKY